MDYLLLLLSFICLILYIWGRNWRKKAERDFLTGLGNYRKFRRVYKSSVNNGYWILLLDLKNSIICNQDSFGYSENDKTLLKFVKLLVKLINKKDLAFRYRSGDEFVVLSKKGENHLSQIVEKLEKNDFNFRYVCRYLSVKDDVFDLEKKLLEVKN